MQNVPFCALRARLGVPLPEATRAAVSCLFAMLMVPIAAVVRSTPTYSTRSSARRDHTGCTVTTPSL
eukprot:12569731-Prorocentrum_lima.AAC.1